MFRKSFWPSSPLRAIAAPDEEKMVSNWSQTQARIRAHSPFLARALDRYPTVAAQLEQGDMDAALAAAHAIADPQDGIARSLRRRRGAIALAVAARHPQCDVRLIEGDDTRWEDQPLTRLAAEDQLRAYEHHRFWQPIDTIRERNLLEDLWASGEAPWKTW